MGLIDSFTNLADFFLKFWVIGLVIGLIVVSAIIGYSTYVSYNTYIVKTGLAGKIAEYTQGMDINETDYPCIKECIVNTCRGK